MGLPEVIPPTESAKELALIKSSANAPQSHRQIITRAVWNSVATFASVAQALRLTAPPQPAPVPQIGAGSHLVCQAGLPVRARRSFAGVAIPRKGNA